MATTIITSQSGPQEPSYEELAEAYRRAHRSTMDTIGDALRRALSFGSRRGDQ